MLPILFRFGSFPIYSFGFFLTLAYLSGTFFLWREGRKRGFAEEKLLDLSVLTLVSALIGGRIFYVLINLSQFSEDPGSIIYFWQGGFAYFGALLAGIFVIWYFSRTWKWPFFQIADLAAIAASLAFCLGKIGSFLAGTDYGAKSSLPWAVTFPALNGARHPVQLYEAAASFLIFLFLLRNYLKNIDRQEGIRSGAVFFDWLILSGIARLVLEAFRADSTYLAGVKLAQIMSLIIATVGVVCLYYFELRDFRRDVRVFIKRISSLDLKIKTSFLRR